MNTESNQNQTAPGRNRRNTAIGVTAGLLGGGAIGLLMGVPSLTSAASDDSGSVSGAAVAAVQVDDTTNSTDTTDATDTVDPAADPGTHLRELLQSLVDDGTITADQADKVAEYLVENRPERGDHGDRRGGHRGPGRDGEVVAGLIGIDVDTLRTELRNGKSVAEIAEANGVDPQTVIDALVDEASGHLDLAVTDGRLTADEAAQALDRMTERITARVNGERPARG